MDKTTNNSYSEKAYSVFQSKAITPDRATEIEEIRKAAAYVWTLFDNYGTNAPGTDAARYFALAKTHLETSVMYFTKGVSRSDV